MRRGTTPTHTFTLPVDTSNIVKLRIAYAQLGRVVLTKTEADVTMEGNTVQLRLAQEETLAFRCSRDVEIQVKALTSAGDSLVSDIMRVEVDRCLCDEVMEHEN
jgi:hypothetical protein